MILSSNMLDLCIVLWIFGKGYCSLIIAVDDYYLGVRLALLVYLIQQVAQLNSLFSSLCLAYILGLAGR